MLPLNPKEQVILESLENDEWNSVPDRSREMQRYQGYAQVHVAELSAGLEEVKIEREHVTLLGRKIKPSKHVLLLRRIYWLLKFSQKG